MKIKGFNVTLYIITPIGVDIINSARNCISSKRNALYIIIAKAKYSLQLMICTFGDEIHAKA